MRVALATQFFPPETFAGANRVSAMAEALAGRCSRYRHRAPAPGYPDPAAYAARTARAGLPRCADPSDRGVHRSAAVVARPRCDREPDGRQACGCRVANAAAGDRGVVAEHVPRPLVSGGGARTQVQICLGSPRPDVGVRQRGRCDCRRDRPQGDPSARKGDVGHGVGCGSDRLCERRPGRGRARTRAETRVEVVRNGVDESLLQMFDPSPPVSHGSARVLYAGLLGHAQELEVLIEVAALAPDLQIVLAGDGPCRAELEDLVRASRCHEFDVHRLLTPAGARPALSLERCAVRSGSTEQAPCSDGGSLEALRVHGRRAADRLCG